MLSVYPACFFKEENGYSVIFPDLNYLSTCGETLDEALNMAVDCLAGYLYTCRREGEKIPSPSPISDVDAGKIAKELELSFESPDDSFVNMITVDVDEYAKNHFEKSVKKTLSIPSWLNDIALENKVNFSQVLQEALMRKLDLK